MLAELVAQRAAQSRAREQNVTTAEGAPGDDQREKSLIHRTPPSFTGEVSDFLGYIGEELLRIAGYTHEFVPASGTGSNR